MIRCIDKEVEDFVSSLSGLWEGEPLDGDETEEIAAKVLAELNHRNGNG